jgi:hypothetical protein
MADQHASLTVERWSRFSRDQQVLMIGNEMHRAAKLFTPGERERLRNCYERILRLSDLTVATDPGSGFRKELLRWRDLIAALYIAPEPSPADHAAAFRCLLRFTPGASLQIPFVLAEIGAGG